MADVSDEEIRSILVRRGVIEAGLAEKALKKAPADGLIELLVRDGLADEDRILKALSEEYDVPAADLDRERPKAEALALITRKLSESFRVLPLRLTEEGRLVVVFGERFSSLQLEDIQVMSSREIVPKLSTERRIRIAIEEAYGDTLQSVIDELGEENWNDVDDVDPHPVVDLVNRLLLQAQEKGATEIHVDPRKHGVQIRMRKDRRIVVEENLPSHVRTAITARLKIVSNLDITERRLPQIGDFVLNRVRYVVATLPTQHGERMIVRIQPLDVKPARLVDSGMTEKEAGSIRDLLRQPGRILFAGAPDINRQLDFLASIMMEIDPRHQVALAISWSGRLPLPEDFSQITTNPSIGLSFSRLTRAATHQRPDVLLLSDVPDLETLSLLLDATKLGVMGVVSMRIADPLDAVRRCLDMGVDATTLAESLGRVVFQYTVDRLCPSCREERPADGPFARTWEAVGCDKCDRGFNGTCRFYRWILADESFRNVLRSYPDLDVLRKAAEKAGYQSLEEAARPLVESGDMARSDLGRI